MGVRFLRGEVGGSLGVGMRLLLLHHMGFDGCWDKGNQDTRCREELGHSDPLHHYHDRESWASNNQFHEMGKASDLFDDTSVDKKSFMNKVFYDT